MTDLDHVDTLELLDELAIRCDGIIIGMYRMRGDDRPNDWDCFWSGGNIIALGLCRRMDAMIQSCFEPKVEGQKETGEDS